ncbi:MAG: hypothetical protein FGM57_03570 [Candidatus Taylorbacteria bacterium]|nr:hypothetical protein [Candidatus Taylorbacteria bacterium]
MIIGFLGKGGSGKSTLATLYTKHLVSQGAYVLAIDADHNMDLSYNLGAPENFPFFGTTGAQFLIDTFGSESKLCSDLLTLEKPPIFKLEKNVDAFTKKYSHIISNNLSFMSTGPHNDMILHGNKCSHSLGTPLKVYLPLLELDENQHVVVDMIASSDAAATGIPTGFSFAYVAVEPTPHSIKAAGQIIETLKFFDVPYGIVLNKAKNADTDIEMIESVLHEKPVSVFMQSNDPLNENMYTKELESLYTYADLHTKKHGDRRKIRSIEKMRRNQEFKLQNQAGR